MLALLRLKLVVPDSLLACERLLIIVSLLIEFLIPFFLLGQGFLTVSILKLVKLVLIPFVQASIFVNLSFCVAGVSSFNIFTITLPCLLFLIDLLSQVYVILVSAADFSRWSLFLVIKFIKVNFLSMSRLLFQLLDFLHELGDLRLQLLLQTFFHLCILLESDSVCLNGDLKLVSGLFTLTYEGLVFLNVLFEVIEDLKLVVEGNERV